MADKPGLPADRMQIALGMTDLTLGERIVVAGISYYDGSGGAYPSMKTIAYDTGMHRLTVNKHIQAAQKKGRLIIDNDQRPNRYTIIYDPDSVVPVPTLNEPEKAAFDPVSVAPVPTLSVVPVPTRTGRTGRTGIREEQEKPGYQEKKVSTAKTQSNGILVGYREEQLQDGTNITVPVYE